jgi:hypothetical protein
MNMSKYSTTLATARRNRPKKLSRRKAREMETSKSTKQAHGRLVRRDAGVKELLTELAVVLLQAGVTPKHFAELAKQAFVEAAGTLSKFSNGKINRSRVAVMTGLSRVEVKRLLTGRVALTGSLPAQQSRGERVISGWMSDHRFLDSRGRPQRLPIAGARVSFASLVKKFGGDVPHRAVLEELRRLRVVRQIGSSLELDARRQLLSGPAAASLSALIPALIDGIRLAVKAASGGPAPLIHRLTLKARDVVELAVLEERATVGMTSLLEGLKGSLQGASDGKKHSLTVTAFVIEQAINNRRSG